MNPDPHHRYYILLQIKCVNPNRSDKFTSPKPLFSKLFKLNLLNKKSYNILGTLYKQGQIVHRSGLNNENTQRKFIS